MFVDSKSSSCRLSFLSANINSYAFINLPIYIHSLLESVPFKRTRLVELSEQTISVWIHGRPQMKHFNWSISRSQHCINLFLIYHINVPDPDSQSLYLCLFLILKAWCLKFSVQKFIFKFWKIILQINSSRRKNPEKFLFWIIILSSSWKVSQARTCHWLYSFFLIQHIEIAFRLRIKIDKSWSFFFVSRCRCVKRDECSRVACSCRTRFDCSNSVCNCVHRSSNDLSKTFT